MKQDRRNAAPWEADREPWNTLEGMCIDCARWTRLHRWSDGAYQCSRCRTEEQQARWQVGKWLLWAWLIVVMVVVIAIRGGGAR